MENILEDNEKLIKNFGAKPMADVKHNFDCYTFTNDIFYSHRDFDSYVKALEKGEKCAIVSGVNASGHLHIGHKTVFDTCLYYQQKYDVPVFVPISDDESYITKKVETQEEGLKNAMELARQLLAYGFDGSKTFFIIDQLYTPIYNLAVKLCRKVTVSEITASYGYSNSDNPGMFFYPCIQSAHILFPQFERGIDNVLVIIGPDEDSHIRIGRDLAARFGVKKPSILHSMFLPGLDGQKMSKSRNNAIFLSDSMKDLQKKVNKSLSGGQETVELHREKGGDPSKDIACFYLSKFFLSPDETSDLFDKYSKGELLSGEVKALFYEHLSAFVSSYQENLEKFSIEDVKKSLLQ